MNHRMPFTVAQGQQPCSSAAGMPGGARADAPVAVPVRGKSAWALAVLVLSLGACSTTAPTPPTPVAAPAQFKEVALWQHATDGRPTTAVPDNWWEVFGDPVLNGLQQRLASDNETIRTAIAKVAAARAQVNASQSAQAPTVSISTGETRSFNANTGSASAAATPVNSASLAATAGWEIDVWGRLSQAVTAAQASWQASVDDLAAARLSVQALLAQNYLSLRTLEAQQALLQRTVEAYQRTLTLTQARYQAGVVQQSDVLQAQTQLNNAQVQLLDTTAQRAQAEHAVAVLVGVPPAAFTLEHTASLPQAPDVPPLLPSTLIERRPDIAAAQQRVASAYAQIGVTDAAFFPALTLSASYGFRNNSYNGLLALPNRFWSIGPTLAQAVFDGGQRRLASEQARAAADQATSSYRQTVLTALQEVEDNLVQAYHLQQEVRLQADAVNASRRNLDITLAQYQAGTVSYLNVVTAQTAALTAENSLLSLRNRQLQAVNVLLKNVAGRWS